MSATQPQQYFSNAPATKPRNSSASAANLNTAKLDTVSYFGARSIVQKVPCAQEVQGGRQEAGGLHAALMDFPRYGTRRPLDVYGVRWMGY